MIAAHIFAGAGFAAFFLFGFRSGLTYARISWAERVVRLFLLLLIATVAVAFLDVAQRQDALLWRQWIVGGVLGGLALSLLLPRPPRRPMIYADDVLAIIDGVAEVEETPAYQHPGCMVARNRIRKLTDAAI